MYCRKCGHEIDGKSPICMYCGSAIPLNYLSPETKERFQNYNERPQNSSSGSVSGVKALGAVILIIGIVTDLVSMFMISSGNFSAFNAMTIFGTIAFFVGLVLYANG